MNVCVIDIGSNTIKASIYKVFKNRSREEIAYNGSKEKLITYIDENGNLNEEGIGRLNSSLSALLTFSEKYRCDKVFAFATASLRGVKNAKEILDIVLQRFDLHVEILSEEDEALCSLKGLLGDLEPSEAKSGVMIDMGGGSTEIVYFQNGKEPIIKSLKFGCLSLSENFDFEDEIRVEKILSYVKNELNNCLYVKNVRCPIYLIGGTARAVLKVINESNKLSLTRLKADGSDLSFIIENMKRQEFYDFVKSIIPARINTILAGTVAYREIVDFIKPSLIQVSESGVRDGYLERILP